MASVARVVEVPELAADAEMSSAASSSACSPGRTPSTRAVVTPRRRHRKSPGSFTPRRRPADSRRRDLFTTGPGRGRTVVVAETVSREGPREKRRARPAGRPKREWDRARQQLPGPSFEQAVPMAGGSEPRRISSSRGSVRADLPPSSGSLRAKTFCGCCSIPSFSPDGELTSVVVSHVRSGRDKIIVSAFSHSTFCAPFGLGLPQGRRGGVMP